MNPDSTPGAIYGILNKYSSGIHVFIIVSFKLAGKQKVLRNCYGWLLQFIKVQMTILILTGAQARLYLQCFRSVRKFLCTSVPGAPAFFIIYHSIADKPEPKLVL
jgi:hypothetical protein